MENSDDVFSELDFLTADPGTFSNEKQNLEAKVTSDDDDGIEDFLRQLTDRVSQKSTNVDPCFNPTDAPNTNEGSVHLKDPPDFNEILSADEKLITPTSHNVTILNSACQQVLKEIERQLLALLKKNRKEQEIVQTFLSSNNKSSLSDNAKKSSVKSVGIPYFKDALGFQPPPNEDILRKQQENQLLPLDFINGFPVWNSADARSLLKSVRSYHEKREAIDWMKISVVDMEGKYSPLECKAKWKLNLDPAINRGKWNRKEMDSLKVLCERYNHENWEKIAKELGTQRSGLQCCIQYMTHTFPTQGKWTKEEDETLEKLVEKYKVKDWIPWPKVAWYFEKRSLKQCQERYAYHLGDIKKGTFTSEEDFLIVYLAPKLKNFGEVAKFLPNRVATQVRARYEYLVELTMPQFSKAEDELLSKLMTQYPRNWGAISSHFADRSRIQCRKRWAFLQRKIKFGGDVQSDSENEEGNNENNSSPEPANNSKSRLDAENYYKVRRNVSTSVRSSRSKTVRNQAYDKLLDYHKNCYKFLFGPKPRTAVSSEDQEKLVKKMKVTMKSLSIRHAGPLSGFDVDGLSNDCEFDKEDLDVLTGLNGDVDGEEEVTKKIIPPNFMTLVGLRSLTLNSSKIKNMCDSYEEPPPDSPVPSLKTDSRDRLLCGDAKKLFKSRLKALFTFPLILSNLTVDNSEIPQKSKKKKPAKPLSKLRRKEHAKLMNAAYREKLKALNHALPEEKEAKASQSEDSKEKAIESERDAKGSGPSRKRAAIPWTPRNEVPFKKRF